MLQAGILSADVLYRQFEKDEVIAGHKIINLQMSTHTENIVDAQQSIKKKFNNGFQPSLCTKEQRLEAWKMQAKFQETVLKKLLKTSLLQNTVVPSARR